ncbi:hypothetical protein FDUTEX481_06649 [Tolypothrix sp. PCC 7601]|nr:hypothetical protein FDUTEX481_06649 [Tolypothrix sp. PCC 7601]
MRTKQSTLVGVLTYTIEKLRLQNLAHLKLLHSCGTVPDLHRTFPVTSDD